MGKLQRLATLGAAITITAVALVSAFALSSVTVPSLVHLAENHSSMLQGLTLVGLLIAALTGLVLSLRRRQ